MPNNRHEPPFSWLTDASTLRAMVIGRAELFCAARSRLDKIGKPRIDEARAWHDFVPALVG